MSKKCKIGWLNVANATGDELYPEFKFARRGPKLIEICKQGLFDVLAFSEFRATEENQAIEWMCDFTTNLRMLFAHAMPVKLSATKYLWLVTMYNPNNIQHLGSTQLETNNTVILVSKFRQLHTHQVFWVVNVHLPMDTKDKFGAICELNTKINALTNTLQTTSNEMIFLGGDQNTFFDKDGEEQMKLYNERWLHMTAQIKHTFKSFPHDKFQVESSVLDHIFMLRQKGLWRLENTFATGAIDTERASDHCMLWLEFSPL